MRKDDFRPKMAKKKKNHPSLLKEKGLEEKIRRGAARARVLRKNIFLETLKSVF